MRLCQTVWLYAYQLQMRITMAPKTLAIGLLLLSACCPPREAQHPHCATVRWLDLDRPVGLRVVNILFSSEVDGRVLEQLRARLAMVATREATSEPANFGDRLDSQTQRARDPIETGVLDVVKDLAGSDRPRIVVPPLISPDGMVVDRRITPKVLVSEVANGVAKLSKRGDVSDVIDSPYGRHVFILLERVPEHLATPAEVSRLCSP